MLRLILPLVLSSNAYVKGAETMSVVPPVSEAKVEIREGQPVVVINCKSQFLCAHFLRNYFVSLGSNWKTGVTNSIRNFAKHGIHCFEADVFNGWIGVDGFEPGKASPGECSYPFNQLMEAVVGADPAGCVLVRLTTDATDEWKEQFPGERETDHTGKKYDISFASDVGFERVTEALKRIVTYIESSPWSGHVVGYNIMIQFEGVPWGSGSEGAFTDYSPAMERAWRAFLKRRYRKDKALQKAWAEKSATIAGACVPSLDEHLGTDRQFIFHHSVQGRKVRDYYDLMDELTVLRHRQVARTVKQASAHRKLVGLMGGYSQDAGEPRSIISRTGFPELQLHKQHFSGPGCWGRAFEIPEIDFYFSPTDYLNTGMGGVCLILNMPASLRLHGKVCFMEDDQRTHLHRDFNFNPMLKDSSESVAAHRRNAALLYTEAGICNWMEQCDNWLLEDAILENLGQVHEFLQSFVTRVFPEPDAICVLIDEESQGWTKPITLLDEALFYHQRNKGLSYCGVPVRYHLLSDLEHDDFPSYKCYLLPNLYHLTPEKEKLLNTKVKRDGNVLVWIYGAGYVGESDFDLSAMARATDMRIDCHAYPWEHRIGISDWTHPITKSLPGDLLFGTSRHYAPIFHVNDADVFVLGRSFGFAMSRNAGLAIREMGRGARGRGGGRRGAGDYASIYCEAPDLPACLLREIARYAGCHVYLESNDFLVAGKDIVMVHSIKPGPRLLALPYRAKITEVFFGEVLAESEDHVKLEFTKPSTFVLRIERNER